MATKLKRGKAELFRILYVVIWTILIAISLLFSIIWPSAGERSYFEEKFLLPLLLAVVLFITELCYTFLDEMYRNKYSNVLGVMICVLLFFVFLFVLIISKDCVTLEYIFLILCFSVLGGIKWLKTPLLPYSKHLMRRVKVSKVETKSDVPEK